MYSFCAVYSDLQYIDLAGSYVMSVVSLSYDASYAGVVPAPVTVWKILFPGVASSGFETDDSLNPPRFEN